MRARSPYTYKDPNRHRERRNPYKDFSPHEECRNPYKECGNPYRDWPGMRTAGTRLGNAETGIRNEIRTSNAETRISLISGRLFEGSKE